MNVVREITRINQTELDIAINNPSASWHQQYSDSAYIFIGGLPYDLTEGDVIAIFSQYGEVVDVNLPRANPNGGEKKDGAGNGASGSQPKPVGKGKHRGFGFLMYEDQRSTVLAVDNLNGAQVLGRTLRVDHVASYKQPKVTDDEGNRVDAESKSLNAAPPELGAGTAANAEMEEEEQGDLEDPMASYFQRTRRQGKGADTDSQEREEKRRRKEERARIRADREERRARASGSTSSARRPAHSPDRHRRSDRDRGDDREDDRDHKRHRSHRDCRDDSEDEGVNRFEQMKKRSVLDTNGLDRPASERHASSRRRSRSRSRSRTPPATSSRRRDPERRDEKDRRQDRPRDRPTSSSHHHSRRDHDARRRSRSPRR